MSANGDTGTKVSGGDTVDFTGDNNITVTQTGKNIATTLNKDLKDLSTISLTNQEGESIFLDGGDGTIKAYKAEFKDNNGAGSSINSDILRFTNGATGANAVETALTLNTLSIQAGPNSTALTSQYLMFSDVDGNNAEGSAKGFYIPICQQANRYNLVLMKSRLVAIRFKKLLKVQLILMR